jgi:hypothetical protein
METTIIKLEPTTGSANVVVRTDATFEEAFGDYSNARGRGRARRKSKKLSKIADKREVKQARRGGRQADRLARRSTRKGARQEMRSSQQEARQERKNVRSSGRQSRKDSKNVSEQDRENYNQDQENTRLSKDPVETESQESGYQDSGSGSESGYQDSGSSSDSGYQDSGSEEEWGGNAPTDENYGDSQYEDGSEQSDSEYSQEENEFADDSIFNFEGMDGKVVVTPLVKDNVYKLKNNARAHKDLSDRRSLMERNGDNTKGIDIQINNTRKRMSELKSCLDDYCNADGSYQERQRRQDEVGMAMGRKSRRRKHVQYGGSEVPVQDGLDASFSKQRIEVPASSNFDGYSDLGRPVIIDGVVQGDENDLAYDLYNDGDEPTVVDLYSNADGAIFKDKKVMGSVLIGIGIGALALYLAKKKNWI